MTRIHVDIPLRWGDLDALGHVNNAVVLRLIEESRLRALFTRDGGTGGLTSAILGGAVGGEDMSSGTLVAKQTIVYLRPIPYIQEPLDVQLWIPQIGGSSMTVCCEIASPRGGDETQVVYARSETVLVLVDTRSGRPIRWPDDIRESLADYAEAAIDFDQR